jgi:hypothetical protein
MKDKHPEGYLLQLYQFYKGSSGKRVGKNLGIVTLEVLFF